MPQNLFYGTGIPATILIFNKGKTNKDVIFIDASREYESIKNQNKLRKEDIEKIFNTFVKKETVEKYSHLTKVEERANGGLKEAIQSFTKAIESMPKEATSYIERGLTYKKMNDFDKALKDYNTAVGLDPKNPIAYFNIGYA